MLTLKVNSLNSLTKRNRMVGCIKEQDPTICCLKEMHLTDRNKEVKNLNTVDVLSMQE
jgi:hypothetical protein